MKNQEQISTEVKAILDKYGCTDGVLGFATTGEEVEAGLMIFSADANYLFGFAIEILGQLGLDKEIVMNTLLEMVPKNEASAE